MKLLLDTHAFIWWARGDSRVEAAWVDPIVDPLNSVYVSAAVAWEIEIKKRNGRLDFAWSTSEVASEFGFELLPISVEHATAAGALAWEHRDPFDRMLVAQSLDDGLVLVTVDPVVASAPGVRVLGP